MVKIIALILATLATAAEAATIEFVPGTPALASWAAAPVSIDPAIGPYQSIPVASGPVYGDYQLGSGETEFYLMGSGDWSGVTRHDIGPEITAGATVVELSWIAAPLTFRYTSAQLGARTVVATGLGVPEPSTLTVAALAIAMTGRLRRHNSQSERQPHPSATRLPGTFQAATGSAKLANPPG
jgi:hypothetical protein